MSHEQADYKAGLPRNAIGTQCAPVDNRGPCRLIAVLILASCLTACSGGAGLDIPAVPVDHGCHNGVGAVLGGDGSGCS